MSSKVTLQVQNPDGSTRAFDLTKHDTFLLGRMEDCHLCLPDDPQVSRHHFLLEACPPQAALRDLIQMNRARMLQDLAVPPGNRLEALKGNLVGYHSIRINAQWRIVFVWNELGPTEVRICDYHCRTPVTQYVIPYESTHHTRRNSSG